MRAFLSFVIALAGCTRGAAHTATPPLGVRLSDSAGIISGFIHDARGSMLRTALVSIGGSRLDVVTDSLGRFRLHAPAGAVALTTRAIGYTTRRDSVFLPPGQGVELDIGLRASQLKLEEVCACDPSALLTLVFHRPANDPIPYIIVLTRERGRPVQRDSLLGAAFIGDTLSAAIVWGPESDSRRMTAIEVLVPGHRPWHRDAIALPAVVSVVLVPVSGPH